MPLPEDSGSGVEFGLAVIDLQGRTRAFLDAYDVKLTRRINGANMLECSVPSDDSKARELLLGSRALRLYRNGETRFMGVIRSPFVDEANWVRVTAYDPFAHFMDLHVGDESLTPRVFTATDAGAIAEALLFDLSLGGMNHLDTGDVDASVLRDRTYEPGKSIGEAVVELANVDDGFFFRIDADGLPVGSKFGTFNVIWPTSGESREDVRFEFGEGTRDNIEESSLEIERFDPVNWVVATGGTDLEGSPLAVLVENAASQSEYGLYQVWAQFSDVTEVTTLRDHAVGFLEPNPRIVARFDALEGAPALFDDFDVGDTVSVYIDTGRVVYDFAARVNQVVLEIGDDSASERLTGIVLETPGNEPQGGNT